MCFHSALSVFPSALKDRYQKSVEKIANFKPMYHVSAFSHSLFPIVTEQEQLFYAQWGLIPYWVNNSLKAKQIEGMTVNARCETIFEKPSFKHLVSNKRCLIPATGFFEWQKLEVGKTPYYIYLKEEPIFSFGGLYDCWVNPENGKEIYSYTIITTPANEMMKTIHNTDFRMPLILPSYLEKEWLNKNTSLSDVKSLLKPYESALMDAYQIERDFIKKDSSDASILAPASTGGLFHS